MRWWSQIDDGALSPQVIADLCDSERPMIARNALQGDALGWQGSIAAASTTDIMTFYPGSDDAQTAFSRQRHHASCAAIKPSLAFYSWLAAHRGRAWQLRGNVAADLAFVDALGLRVTSTSLWGGAGSRTPLHVDSVHALILELAGTKKVFLSSTDAVARAVDAGRLPRAALDDGATESYCVDGTLASVYGLDDDNPKCVDGQLVVVNPGDVLVLPAGVYHDVECESPALSLSIRFELDEQRPERLADFLRRLAAKKALADLVQHRDRPS